MLGQGQGNPAHYPISLYLDHKIYGALLLGVLTSMPVVAWVSDVYEKMHQNSTAAWHLTFDVIRHSTELVVVIIILISSLSFLAVGTYNPFIYFRF